MKRIAILAVLVTAATASAAVDGTYSAGNTKTGSGVRMTVSGGKFSVKIIRFRETCHFRGTFTEYFTFKSGTRAHLSGTIKADDTFSGKYVASAGYVKVHGSFSGPSATITATEGGDYNPATTEHPNSCYGKHTFHANLPTG